MAIATCNFSHLERKPAESLDPISCPVCYEEEITPRKLYGHNQAGAVLDPKQHAICKTCLDQTVQERLLNPNLNAVRPFPTCIQCVLPILKIDGINIALKKRVLDQFDRLHILQD